jgi:hypothetical protein
VAEDSVAISQPDLVTLAVSELGGASRAIDTEEVAVKARELSPRAFAWRLYPEHINLELVRVALVGASRASLVQGRGRGGWVLTDRGVEWIRIRRERLLSALGKTGVEGSARVKQPETQHRERERIRIGRSDAWHKWNADQYTSATNRLTKVRTLRVLFAGDPDLGQFLDAMTVLAASPAPDQGAEP